MSSKIEKKDLKTIYRRYLALNCMNDYPGQMHNGYTFSLLPVLDKIYKDNKEELIKAKKRHMEYFNITPNIAGNRVSPIADSGPINAVFTVLIVVSSNSGFFAFSSSIAVEIPRANPAIFGVILKYSIWQQLEMYLHQFYSY